MCKVIISKFKDLKGSYAADMLKGSFPKCGIKYTGKYGHGLVLVRYDVTDFDSVKEKAKAASDSVSHVFVIPKQIEMAVGL